MKIYQTDNMEEALRAMARRNHLTMVYSQFRAVRPIRMRVNMLRDIDIELCIQHKPFAQATIDRWANKGGVMIYRPYPIGFKHLPPPTDAQLFAECPYQADKFELLSAKVRQEVVVYRPPTWELHNETIDHIYPNSSAYVAFDAMFESLVGRELTEAQASVMALSGVPVERAAVFEPWDIEAITGWKEKFIKGAITRQYRFNFSRWHVYSTRIPPDDEDMRWAYDLLRTQHQVAPECYGLRFNFPIGGRIPGFEKMLNKLLLYNYVVREDNIYVVDVGHPPLDYDKINAINNMHRGRWFKMKTIVDESPEYDLETSY